MTPLLTELKLLLKEVELGNGDEKILERLLEILRQLESL